MTRTCYGQRICRERTTQEGGIMNRELLGTKNRSVRLMKAPHLVLWIMMAGAFAVLQSRSAMAGGGGGIKLPSGNFSVVLQGSLAVCLNPSTFAEEACTTSGALVFPVTVLQTGALTIDDQGDFCGSPAEVDSALPPGTTPPSVATNLHSTGKLLDYDNTTGAGDSSFTAYAGGACNGSTFDSSGATQTASGTYHLVVAEDGKRMDLVVTQLTNPSNSVGTFSLSGTDRKQ